MTLAEILHIALPLSVCANVFALGLEAEPGDAKYLLGRPWLLLRSLLAMNVVMVGLALAIMLVFNLGTTAKVILIALAVSPVPPALPKKNLKAGGSQSYGVGLLVAAVLVSIVLVPAWSLLLGHFFGLARHVSPGQILPVVAITGLLPLFGGMVFRLVAPAAATRLAPPLGRVAGILLILAVLPVLVVMAGPMWHLLSSGVVPALIAFSLAGLVIGHIAGGPEPDERTVLALATSARHPGVVIVIISVLFPGLKAAALPVVAWHLVIAALLSFGYLLWRKRFSPRASTPDTSR